MTKYERDKETKDTLVELIKIAIKGMVESGNFGYWQVVTDSINHVCCNDTCEEILSLVFDGDRDLMESFYDTRTCERCDMLDFADAMVRGYCECCADDMGRRWL